MPSLAEASPYLVEIQAVVNLAKSSIVSKEDLQSMISQITANAEQAGLAQFVSGAAESAQAQVLSEVGNGKGHADLGFGMLHDLNSFGAMSVTDFVSYLDELQSSDDKIAAVQARGAHQLAQFQVQMVQAPDIQAAQQLHHQHAQQQAQDAVIILNQGFAPDDPAKQKAFEVHIDQQAEAFKAFARQVEKTAPDFQKEQAVKLQEFDAFVVHQEAVAEETGQRPELVRQKTQDLAKKAEVVGRMTEEQFVGYLQEELREQPKLQKAALLERLDKTEKDFAATLCSAGMSPDVSGSQLEAMHKGRCEERDRLLGLAKQYEVCDEGFQELYNSAKITETGMYGGLSAVKAVQQPKAPSFAAAVTGEKGTARGNSSFVEALGERGETSSFVAAEAAKDAQSRERPR